MNEAEFEQFFEEQREAVRAIGLEVMTEIWAQMPWGHEFKLSNGRTARISELNGGAGRSRPQVREDGSLSMLFDVQIDQFSLDHIEFHITQTGQGGGIRETPIVQMEPSDG